MRSHARSLRGLTDIRFTFDPTVVHELTDTAFFDYAEGADLVVLGRFKNPDAIPTHLTVQIQYKDLEDKIWREDKIVKIRQLSAEGARGENVEKFAGQQQNYNPIKQQWAVTAVHQLLKRRTMATTQEHYDSLTKKAKELSYAHNIVSPVVSFLVRKPKSAFNLINSDKLDGHGIQRRDAGKAEAHEVRYQYRKLWWRSDHKDELEKATELLKEQPSVGSTNATHWTGLGSFPAQIYIPLNERDQTCLTLPNSLSGTFTLYAHDDLTTSATINDRKLESIIFRSGSAVFEIGPAHLSAESNGVPLALDSSKQLFKVENLVIEVMNPDTHGTGSFVITHLTDSVQFRVQQHDSYLDVRVFGLDDKELVGQQGLMVELSKYEASLLETQSLRQHTTSTLWINGQYIPVLLTESSFGSTEECWNVKEDSSSRIFHN